MTYITCQEASNRYGVSLRRIQQLCKTNKIKGAKKEGKSWMIPDNFNYSSTHQKKKKPLPIGISDFKKATSEYYYVDKTLLIRDFLDSKPQVSLFTRPRRFGKTLTMDMLRVFFEKTNEDTSIYFKDKFIWSCGTKYTSYQGQYPVIFLTFKDIKCNSWEETYNKLCKLIALEFLRHNELETSSKLNEYEKKQYINLSRNNATEIDYQMSLQILSLLLYKHYAKDCIIIIDEYDVPIEQGYVSGFYDKTIDFMRNFFSGGLKDNTYLAFGFLTGILKVAKESIFSGLNNLKINSILDENYSEYFGFTKEEVVKMLEYYDVKNKYQEICSWYDGYIFGNTEIFNPWSVINYISNNCFPKAFWLFTGSNDIIGEIISKSTDETIIDLQKLLTGEKITTYIDTNVIYPDVITNAYSIYSFLLVAGYLKIDKTYPQDDGNYMCDVTIPNKEIKFVYEKEVLEKTGKTNIAILIQQAIFQKDINKFQNLLEQFMIESISYYDGSNESFYHGMMLGLCAILSNKYHVRSNQESGDGRFDIQLYPENKNNPGFIFELKKAKNINELESLANIALNQIERNNYDALMKKDGVNEIIKIGIAFYGKHTSIKSIKV